jgi:cell division septum initiation protein DivIVA
MSQEVLHYIEQIENKLNRLYSEVLSLRAENISLKSEIEKLRVENLVQKNQDEHDIENNNFTNIAKSNPTNQQFRAEMLRKIDELVAELNSCINTLND